MVLLSESQGCQNKGPRVRASTGQEEVTEAWPPGVKGGQGPAASRLPVSPGCASPFRALLCLLVSAPRPQALLSIRGRRVLAPRGWVWGLHTSHRVLTLLPSSSSLDPRLTPNPRLHPRLCPPGSTPVTACGSGNQGDPPAPDPGSSHCGERPARLGYLRPGQATSHEAVQGEVLTDPWPRAVVPAAFQETGDLGAAAGLRQRESPARDTGDGRRLKQRPERRAVRAAGGDSETDMQMRVRRRHTAG